MTEALVGLGLMMVLALLRIPIAIAMGVIGFLGVAYMRDWNFAPAMAMVGDQGLRDRTQLYSVGDPALHPDGQSGDARRDVAATVSRRSCLCRPSARRACDGNGGGLRRLRRHLRIVDCDRGDHGQGGLSVHEVAWLFRQAVDRIDRGRRNARHSDSAIDPDGDLRGDDRNQYRQDVCGRPAAGNSRNHSVVPGGAMDRIPRSGLRAARNQMHVA